MLSWSHAKYSQLLHDKVAEAAAKTAGSDRWDGARLVVCPQLSEIWTPSATATISTTYDRPTFTAWLHWFAAFLNMSLAPHSRIIFSRMPNAHVGIGVWPRGCPYRDTRTGTSREPVYPHLRPRHGEWLCVARDSGCPQDLDLGDDFKVAAADELLAKLERIFGERVAVLR